MNDMLGFINRLTEFQQLEDDLKKAIGTGEKFEELLATRVKAEAEFRRAFKKVLQSLLDS